MKHATRVAAALFILIGSSFVFAEDTPPTRVWTEEGPGKGRNQSWNLYYGNVSNGNFYAGELSYGPLAYGQTQTGDPATARINGFDVSETNGARNAVVIGNYIFFNRTDKGVGLVHVNRLNSDWTNLVAYPTDNTVNGIPNDLAPEGMTTDGTSLFTTQSGTTNSPKNVIRKYSITNQADSFTLTKTLNVTIPGVTAFRGLSYYNGKIYAVDSANTVDKGIYEIDATTGVFTQIGTHVGTNAYQAVRYGNKLFVVDGNEGGTSNFRVYDIVGGTLGASTVYSLDVGDGAAGSARAYWGVGVVGTSSAVTGFWVNSSNGFVSYFSCSFSIVTCNTPSVDADDDNDVDQDDFGVFQRCFLGTAVSVPAGPGSNYFCTCFDKDGINGVDSLDLGTFEACLTAPAVTWAPSENCQQ